MPWSFPWSESLKKHACRHLLQHYLGHFLKEKLTLDQLSVDLYNGRGNIKNLDLDVESLNEELDSSNIPVEIVDGYINEISVAVPWTSLIQKSTEMEIYGLELTLQPKQRCHNASIPEAMFSSMSSLNSMSTSLQVAEECMKSEKPESSDSSIDGKKYEGVQKFAQTIDSVLCRVKVTLIDTTVRVEHLPYTAEKGVALEFRIKRIEFYDEMAADDGSSVDEPRGGTKWEPAAVAQKNILIDDIQIFSDEFTRSSRQTDLHSDSSCSSPQGYGSAASSPPYSGLSPSHRPSYKSDDTPKTSMTSLDNEPTQIASLTGRTSIKLKLKQEEKLSGPKVSTEVDFGALHILFSPKQFYDFLELVEGLSSPATNDNIKRRSKSSKNRPMSSEDDERIQRELQLQLQSRRVNQQMYAQEHFPSTGMQDILTHSLEEEQYFSLASARHTSDMESSISSNFSLSSNRSSSTVTTENSNFTQQRKEPPYSRHSKDSGHRMHDDPSAELCRYHLRIGFFSVAILHENPSSRTDIQASNVHTEATKATTMKEISTEYFQKVFSFTAAGKNELKELRKNFSSALRYDHLRFVGKPLNVECNEKTAPTHTSLSLDATIGLFEVVECLFDRRSQNADPEYTELLVFKRDVTEVQPTSMYSSMHGGAPCVKITLQQYQGTKSKRSSPKTDVGISFGQCESEFDITIIDRIHSLMNPEPVTRTRGNSGNNLFAMTVNHNTLSQMEEGPGALDRKTNFTVNSTLLKLSVRFPIPDLRSSAEHNRLPWWQKNLRDEVLMLNLADFGFKTTFTTNQSLQQLDFSCREAHGYFRIDPNQSAVYFAHVTGDENEDGFNWPSMIIKFCDKTTSVLEEEVIDSDNSTPLDSLNGACNFVKTESSPFSNKKHMYGKEEMSDKNEARHVSEEMIMPGDRAEILEFQEKSVGNTLMVVELVLPFVNLFLPSKHFFEVLYNRLNNDLLLWEPMAPSPLQTQDPSGVSVQPFDLSCYTHVLEDRFELAHSAIQYNSSDDEDDTSFGHYSIHDSKHPKTSPRNKEQPSKLCLLMHIDKGKLTAFTESKVENKHGEAMCMLEDANLFTTSNHNGDPTLQYICFYSNRAEMYHAGAIDNSERFSSVMEEDHFTIPKHLENWKLIYPSECHMSSNISGDGGYGTDTPDMVSVAVRVKQDKTSVNVKDLTSDDKIKEFLVSVGVQGATLRHRMAKTGQSWIFQIMDYLDVKDYDILGYVLPKVLTELHIHLWNCAVDYRPLYIPTKAVLAVEAFSVSSNIVANSPTSLLRFVIDDAGLFLSQNKVNVLDLKKDYVCVADLERFELTLCSYDGNDQKYPKKDMKVSTNKLNIRTCSDSCRALTEIIRYFVNDEDLRSDNEQHDFGISDSEPDLSISDDVSI
ncbi:hypothetical protein KUTeg_014276 [Tegillarca granosa]|uniref:Autophagy-related protein 2 n=1 Tax=Tegillarca granosa TaxID=220873 RepID=A0ABQ9F0J3_TEGGR|nr:hypothetical protein KUTeg_014276 [Tegillarca granosa]